jgi:hypothetical protein
MRPRGARSWRHCLPRRAGTTAAIFHHPIFLPPIFLPLEAKWGQARNSEPVKIRSSDLRYRNRCNVGRRIDAPGDGRAPGAIAHTAAPGRPRPSFSTPFFCLPFFCHWKRNGDRHVNSEPIQIRLPDLPHRNRCNIGRRIDAPERGALPARLLTPPRRDDRGHLSPPHLSATHFSAIPFFGP